MKKFFLRIIILISIVFTGYFIWSYTGRAAEKEFGWSQWPEFKTRFNYLEAGIDSGKGSIIAVQPYLTAFNYSTAYNFELSLRFYFEQLKREDKLSDKSIVLLPQHIGTWLVIANEKEKIYKKTSIKEAIKTIIASNLFRYSVGYLQSSEKNNKHHIILHLKARKMANQYQQVFSTLAKTYNCTIVAGSIILPDASISSAGELEVSEDGVLYNTAVVFGNDGVIRSPLVKQRVTTESESGLIKSGDTSQTSILQTNAGKMAVLIDAVSLPAAFNSNQQNRADFLVVPSFGSTYQTWSNVFNKTPALPDTTLNKNIFKPAVDRGIHQAMNVFFTGHIWDVKLAGSVCILQNDSTTVLSPTVGKGRIVALYLR
jgi:hypothetical protein